VEFGEYKNTYSLGTDKNDWIESSISLMVQNDMPLTDGQFGPHPVIKHQYR